MAKYIPERLVVFFNEATQNMDDGCEYSTELHRLLSANDCQEALTSKEIEALRYFADEVLKVGEINSYSEEKILQLEKEIFGQRGVLGYLSHHHSNNNKPLWPF